MRYDFDEKEIIAIKVDLFSYKKKILFANYNKIFNFSDLRLDANCNFAHKSIGGRKRNRNYLQIRSKMHFV